MTADHTLPSPDKWAGREIAPDDYVHDWEAGRRQKADWPSHLAEIMHAYNATQSAVTGYSPHYLMFGWQPRFPVDFVFPTIGRNEAPVREASAKFVDMYIASIWDRLRTTLWEAQAWSTVEACRQKWHYDRKIGTVNLKPGDLVLVKADAWKGKKKIKDRWKEETWEVVHQIEADVPFYKVMNQCRRSWVLHWNWLLLVASQIGIPLCMGSHHTWDRCTSSTSCKTISVWGEKRGHYERKVVRQSPNNLPVKLPWDGKTGSCGFCCGHLLEHPLRMGKTTGDVMWLQTLEGTHT